MYLECYKIRSAFEVAQPKKFSGVQTVNMTRTTRNNDETHYRIPF